MKPQPKIQTCNFLGGALYVCVRDDGRVIWELSTKAGNATCSHIARTKDLRALAYLLTLDAGTLADVAEFLANAAKDG